MKRRPETDVLIIGAGAAGIGAAVGAADCGAKVTLIEKLNYPGGRATASAVGTVCGTYFRGEQAKFLMSGFPKDFAQKLIVPGKNDPVPFADKLWFIPCLPSDFEATANYFLKKNNIQTIFNSELKSININNSEINHAEVKTATEVLSISPGTVIDCSGIGATIPLSNHSCLPQEEKQQASAMVFCLDDVVTDDEFKLHHILLKYITHHIQQGIIPEHYNLISIIPSSIRDQSLLLKVGIPWNAKENSNPPEKKAIDFIHDVYLYLQASVPPFKDSRISWIAKEMGQRTGIRPKCRQVLNEHEVLSCLKSKETICNGGWPIEFWETGNKKVEMTYFSEYDNYSIPAGSLISDEIKNLFFAGKLISATEKAIASARVIGTCLGTGYAAGVLAAYKSQNKPEADAIHFIQSTMLSSQ